MSQDEEYVQPDQDSNLVLFPYKRTRRNRLSYRAAYTYSTRVTKSEP